MALESKRALRELLDCLLDDQVRFHEIVWSLHSKEFAKESAESLIKASIQAALAGLERGWIKVLRCDDEEKEHYFRLDDSEAIKAISDPSNWNPEIQKDRPLWFDITAAGKKAQRSEAGRP